MSEEIDLKELLSYYKSKIVFIIIVLIFVIGVGNAYTLLTRTPMYKSETSIVLVSENKENYNTTELQLNKNLVGTYTEIIKSRKVLEPVIKNLKLKTSYNKLKNRVTVTSVQNTEIIKVAVADSNPKEAKKKKKIIKVVGGVATVALIFIPADGPFGELCTILATPALCALVDVSAELQKKVSITEKRAVEKYLLHVDGTNKEVTGLSLDKDELTKDFTNLKNAVDEFEGGLNK